METPQLSCPAVIACSSRMSGHPRPWGVARADAVLSMQLLEARQLQHAIKRLPNLLDTWKTCV